MVGGRLAGDSRDLCTPCQSLNFSPVTRRRLAAHLDSPPTAPAASPAPQFRGVGPASLPRSAMQRLAVPPPARGWQFGLPALRHPSRHASFPASASWYPRVLEFSIASPPRTSTRTSEPSGRHRVQHHLAVGRRAARRPHRDPRPVRRPGRRGSCSSRSLANFSGVRPTISPSRSTTQNCCPHE